MSVNEKGFFGEIEAIGSECRGGLCCSRNTLRQVLAVKFSHNLGRKS